MKYQKVVEFEYNPVGSFRRGDPYTTAFCRTLKHDNVLVKGGLEEVRRHIHHHIGPALVAYRFWYHGRSRGYLRLENCPVEFYLRVSKIDGRKMLSLWTAEPERERIASWRRCPSTFPRVLRRLLNE